MDETEMPSIQDLDETEMTSIQDMSFDSLKYIMMRIIPETPSSGFEMFNTFLMCKAFQELSYDESILKELDFEDLAKYSLRSCDQSLMIQWQKCNAPNLSTFFQAFHRMGGFILRAAKAGNLSAWRNLGKLIIRCASVLFRDRNEISSSNEVPPQDEGNGRSSICVKASSVLAYFTAENAGANTAGELLHSELVKEYLFAAKLKEVQEMQTYIEDYVKYFRDPVVEVDPARLRVMLELSDGSFERGLQRAYDNAFEATNQNMLSSDQHHVHNFHMDLSMMLLALRCTSVHWFDYYLSFDDFLQEGSIEVALPGYVTEETPQNAIYVPLAWFLKGWYKPLDSEIQEGNPRRISISRIIEQIYMFRERLLRVVESIIEGLLCLVVDKVSLILSSVCYQTFIDSCFKPLT